MIKKFKLPEKTIYHYCSVASLLSIISEANIFLSHSQYLNDYMESKWIRKTIDNCKNQAAIRFDSYCTNKVRKIISNYRGKAYLACFSANKDTLSQWRAYADDGFGVSIGFNFDKIRSKFSTNLKLENIIYHKENQNRRVTEILTKYIPYENNNQLELRAYELKQKLQSEYHSTNITWSSEKIREISRLKLSDIISNKHFKHESTQNLSQCVKDIIILSHFLKNQAFHEEDEYRLCYFPGVSETSNVKINFISSLEHRCSNKKIIPYHSFKFENFKSCIKEIVLGPRCQTDEYAIRSLLKKLDYNNILITRSTASYR